MGTFEISVMVSVLLIAVMLFGIAFQLRKVNEQLRGILDYLKSGKTPSGT